MVTVTTTEPRDGFMDVNDDGKEVGGEDGTVDVSNDVTLDGDIDGIIDVFQLGTSEGSDE